MAVKNTKLAVHWPPEVTVCTGVDRGGLGAQVGSASAVVGLTSRSPSRDAAAHTATARERRRERTVVTSPWIEGAVLGTVR